MTGLSDRNEWLVGNCNTAVGSCAVHSRAACYPYATYTHPTKLPRLFPRARRWSPAATVGRAASYQAKASGETDSGRP